MATTFKKIETIEVGAGGSATIDFISISSGFTDLCVKVSARNDTGVAQTILLSLNNSTSSFSQKYIEGAGSGTPASGSVARWVGSSGDSANIFSNFEMYFPNYTSSNYKSWSTDSVTELNGNPAYATLIAGLWSDTSAINRITLTQSGGNFRQYSSATLYGIKKS